MKDECQMLRRVVLVGAAVLLAPLARAQSPQLVFDNSTTDLGIRFNPGTNQVGDEIVLDPSTHGYRNIADFTFEYWGVNFGGLEQADVRFYANNGPASSSGPPMPGSLLFDSGWFNIMETDRNTLRFYGTKFTTGVAVPLVGQVPDDFTWTVQFRNLGPGASAGVDLYNPPTVGLDYDDYWYNTGGTWNMMAATNGTPVNFAARIDATPEPATVWLGLLGGLALLGAKWRAARR